MASLDYLMASFPDHISDQDQLEERLNELVWQGDWDAVLAALDNMPDTISHKAASDCLTRAVHTASVSVMHALLDKLPEGEYGENEGYRVSWSPTGQKYRRHHWELNVQGTLVMHAVAEGRGQLLSLLLSRGMDANSASPEAAEMLMNDFGDNTVSYGHDFSPIKHHTARAESRIRLERWDCDPESIPPMEIEGATPLALAVIMGRVGAARQLIENGAWTDAPSVSQSMFLFWMENDADYRAAREEVLKTGVRPVLWAGSRCCSPQQLKWLLENYEYTADERAAAGRSMLTAYHYQEQLWHAPEKRWDDLCQRLMLLGDAICAPEVIGEVLRLCFEGKNCSIEPFMPLLRGKTLDLSFTGTALYSLSRKSNLEQFSLLAENCRLVMDRDAVFSGVPQKALRQLLDSVSFLPPSADCGISGLTLAILRSGNLRLIRRALREGIIPPQESTAELLQCQKELGLPASCRSLILTRPALPCPPPKVGRAALFRMPSRWFSRGISPDTMPLVTDDDPDGWFCPSLRGIYGRAIIEGWEIHSILHGLCAVGKTELVRRWLCAGDDLMDISAIFALGRRLQLVMTPLCTAAFFGQTETVALLLEAGAPADEESWGNPSSVGINRDGTDEFLPLSPITAALLAGHYDTARLLTQHGAEWERFKNILPHLWQMLYGEEKTAEEITAPLK